MDADRCDVHANRCYLLGYREHGSRVPQTRHFGSFSLNTVYNLVQECIISNMCWDAQVHTSWVMVVRQPGIWFPASRQ